MLKRLGSVVLLALVMAVNLLLLTSNRETIFVDGEIYFVDADCYSRMTRVQQVLANPFQRIDYHQFENYPDGTFPHTTAPLDLLIAGLAVVLQQLSDSNVDLAGAWISPLLGMLLLVGVYLAVGPALYRMALLITLAVSPMVVQAFQLGRPDHQSLTLLLIILGVLAELRLRMTRVQHGASRAVTFWALGWALAWGLALWVTLYESTIVLALVLATRVVSRRPRVEVVKPQSPIERRPYLIAAIGTLIVLGLGLCFDGWRMRPLPPETFEYFPRWSLLLAELRSVPPLSPQWLGWFGLLLPFVAPLAIWQKYRGRERSSLLTANAGTLVFVAAITYGLAIWQIRWAPFFLALAALLVPAALLALRKPFIAWPVFVLSLLPVAQVWDNRLFPDAQAAAVATEQRMENRLLRQAARALVSTDTTPILAPWWLCPAITYWSGQPCVGGSSHQSLPGIVDTARFYAATTPEEALEIAADRGVRYVIAYEPERLNTTSARLLDRPVIADTVATAIFNQREEVDGLTRVPFPNPFFPILEVD